MRLALALTTVLSTAMWANAQITEVATVNGRYYPILSLELAGPMYLQPTGGGFQLFNPDLTLYQSTVYPALPSNCEYTSGLEYVTEALFDQDPSTIEYMIRIQCDTTNGTGSPINGALIARLDGTILLLDTLFGTGGVNGIDLFSSRPPIFNTSLGTRLSLFNQAAGGSTRIYALPGTLPCIDCSGGIGMSLPSDITPTPAVTLFPNPGSNTVTLTVKGSGHEGYSVSIYDGMGRLARNIGKVVAERIEFSVDGFAPGYYEVKIQDTDRLVVRTLPLVVEH